MGELRIAAEARAMREAQRTSKPQLAYMVHGVAVIIQADGSMRNVVGEENIQKALQVQSS